MRKMLISVVIVVGFLAGVTAIATAGGRGNQGAAGGDEFPHPEWVRPDGTVDVERSPDTVPCIRNDGSRGTAPNRMKQPPPALGTPEHAEAVRRSDELRSTRGVTTRIGPGGGETLILEDTPEVRAYLDKYNPCR